MSASVFLDTLRKHDLDQFYTTFSTHGITQLQNLVQLSVQDYAALGITDIGDRKKIFSLIQMLRKETLGPERLRLVTSSSSTTSNTSNSNTSMGGPLTSGLRQPQSYRSMSYHEAAGSVQSPTSPNAVSSRLPQLHTASPTVDHGQYTRMRRQSTAQPPPKMPSSPATRHVRSRTMSDAGSSLPRAAAATAAARRTDLRRSVLVESYATTTIGNNVSSEEDEEIESPRSTRRYRTSAPMLNAYGVPVSPMKSRANVGALKQATDILPPSDLDQKIRVCVRKRPLNRKEQERNEKDIAQVTGTRTLHIHEPKLRLDLTRYIEQHSFTFDDVFDSSTENSVVYERTALPLVHYIFKGGKATCFAYGQTGSGKTFTMLDPRHGLYVLAARDIFALLKTPEYQHLSAWIGLYEIYQGQLYDLLNNRKKLFAREDGKQNVVISGLKEYLIDNVDNLVQVFAYGNQIRSTGTTGANDTSSRSHAVLQILLKPKKNRKSIHGKLSFIDLAGSERGADRGESDTKTRMEGAEINKSLLALKECIRALDQDKRHTPFRQSKLTQVLKDSFVGNSRTCMIATVSPGGSNSEHTLNTLRYADRVKELKGERDRSRKSSKANVFSDYEDKRLDDEEDDGDLSNESDILDDRDLDADDDIFNVDFPHEQDALISSSSYPLSLQGQMAHIDDGNDSYESSPSPSPFDVSQMEKIINLHRAQLRQVTEYTKMENKLVGQMSLGLSSLEFDSEAEASSQFRDYLRELDEILEEKAGAIDAFRDRISETVSQVTL